MHFKIQTLRIENLEHPKIGISIDEGLAHYVQHLEKLFGLNVHECLKTDLEFNKLSLEVEQLLATIIPKVVSKERTKITQGILAEFNNLKQTANTMKVSGNTPSAQDFKKQLQQLYLFIQANLKLVEKLNQIDKTSDARRKSIGRNRKKHQEFTNGMNKFSLK